MTARYLIGVQLVTEPLRRRHPEIGADVRHAIVTHLGDQETIITQSWETARDGNPLAPSGRPLAEVCARLAEALHATLVPGVTRW